jgi:hypothetical protein
MYNQERRSQMPTEPTKKRDQKPGKRGKISIDRIVEKDLEIPADVAKNIKGGRRKLRPPLVPIPR